MLTKPSTSAVALAGLAIAITTATYSLLLADRRVISAVAAREGLIEQIGALLFVGSSILSFLAFLTVLRKPRSERKQRPVLYLLLAAFFFVAFGEEVSWGSHGISDKEREDLFPNNIQNEFNIHNLTIFDEYDKTGKRKTGYQVFFTANRLFDYFMVFTFILMPWACIGFSSLRNWLTRNGIPVLPAVFSWALIANLALTVTAELRLVDDSFMHGAVSEIREFNYALLCFLGVLFLYMSTRRVTSETHQAAGQVRS